jgi:UDP-N-acetylmuramate--alanine ligase
MVGMGGAGMRGIARLLLSRGVAVSGSDLKDSKGLDELRALGAEVSLGHRAEQLHAAGLPDAVVVSSAIGPGNPEVEEARARGVPVWARAQVLAALMAESPRAVAVAGTHGKTTTTSMLCVILDRAGLDPTYVIGGDLNESGSGARRGAGEWFVAETDESDGSFLLMRPEVAVVTNVGDDHLDFYRDGAEIRGAFGRFFQQAEVVVACGDDDGAREALALSGREAMTYGTGAHNRARVEILDADDVGARGVLEVDGERVELALRVRPRHNVLNASAAVLAALRAGVSLSDAADALGSFTGVRRRFEFRGVTRGAEFYDDYAVHPTEVAAVLGAVPSGYRRTLAVVQPHRYTRTRVLGRSLGASVAPADVVVVTEVYGAGEEPIPGVTGKLVLDGLAESASSKRVLYLPRRSDVVQFLLSEIRSGDFVLTLGAGDITTLADEVMERARGPA